MSVPLTLTGSRSVNGLIALVASAAIIVSAAYVSDISRAIQSTFPGQYRVVVGGFVVIAITTAVAAVARGIREHRARRYGALALAIGTGAGYFARFRTGNADVDVVEAFHFVEYGALAWLFYRAWRHLGDARCIAFPLFAGVVVATLDESLQSFLASRVGEAHDVLLDLAAVVCGLLVALALDPPAGSALTPKRTVALHVAAAAAAALVLLAGFVSVVHVGYEIEDSEIGIFRSSYSAANLQQLAGERARTWSHGLPSARGRFAREDHYLTEALWHVRDRNDAVELGDTVTAWRENRILEKFYAPLLDLPAVNAGYRWPPEQRALIAEAAARAQGVPYVSQAHALPIYAPKLRPRLVLWKP
jgi:hypothetical protein